MDRQTRGIFEECNSDMCDSCDLNYDQGNMGEQKETLRMAIKALEIVERIKARKRELEKKLQGSFSLSEATEHGALCTNKTFTGGRKKRLNPKKQALVEKSYDSSVASAL
jgi:hypothetical protein